MRGDSTTSNLDRSISWLFGAVFGGMVVRFGVLGLFYYLLLILFCSFVYVLFDFLIKSDKEK